MIMIIKCSLTLMFKHRLLNFLRLGLDILLTLDYYIRMIYEIVLLRVGPEASELRSLARLECDTASTELENALAVEAVNAANMAVAKVAGNEPAPGTPGRFQPNKMGRGRKSRDISVLNIGAGYERAGVSPASGPYSSSELSRLLGYSYNMVLQQFNYAARAREEALKQLKGFERDELKNSPLEATLRGVTFAYTDELAPKEV